MGKSGADKFLLGLIVPIVFLGRSDPRFLVKNIFICLTSLAVFLDLILICIWYLTYAYLIPRIPVDVISYLRMTKAQGGHAENEAEAYDMLEVVISVAVLGLLVVLLVILDEYRILRIPFVNFVCK